MQAFTTHTGLVATMDRANVDTDQIIPKQFLKRIERSGYGPFLFYDWRYFDDGQTPNPAFELNQPKPEAEAVIKPFQEALGLSPADVGLRLEYAAALERLGDKDFSREQYREALRRDDELPRDEPKGLPARKRKEIEAMITR